MIDPVYLPSLDSSEKIETASVLRNGYGYISINTAKYPFNITAFRRALAFALDKQAISDEIWNGLSVPLDSCVPAVNPFSCEGLLPYTYYAGNVELGNQVLDTAGFEISNITGFRLLPNGDPFDVLVEPSQSSNIAIDVGEKTAETLRALMLMQHRNQQISMNIKVEYPQCSIMTFTLR
jgi:ABC-type transport system substrate-binding protein